MEKRAHAYQLRLESFRQTKAATGLLQARNEEEHPPVEITFTNHDNIFEIITRLENRQLFDSKQDATEFGIGLKMFSEVILRHRHHPLFANFLPAFRAFMKTLKSS